MLARAAVLLAFSARLYVLLAAGILQTNAPCTLRDICCWQCYKPPDELLVDVDEVEIQGKDWAVRV